MLTVTVGRRWAGSFGIYRVTGPIQKLESFGVLEEK